MKKFLLIAILVSICLSIFIFAEGYVPSRFISGNENTCYVYNYNECPDDASPLFYVDPHFSDQYGSHISDYMFDGHNYTGFNQILCCKNMTDPYGSNNHIMISYDQLPSYPYGVHIEPAGFAPQDIIKANEIVYADTCPENHICAFQVQEDGTGNFTNSHVFNCNSTESLTGGDLLKVCYKNLNIPPPPPGLCEDGEYEQPCDPNIRALGEGEHDGTRMYCSFGPDDEVQGGEQGYCCEIGQYWWDTLGQCIDSNECGFDQTDDCSLYNGTGIDMSLYLTSYYFNQMSYGLDCINLATQQSCCNQVEKFGVTGNYYCDIITTEE